MKINVRIKASRNIIIKLLTLLFLLSLLYSFQTLAYSLENFFTDDYLNAKIILNPNLVPNVSFNQNLELDNYDYIKQDPENLVDPFFKVPDYLSSSVKFWFDIYTKYDETTTLVHDKVNFDLIYGTISFTELDYNNVGPITKANFRQQMERERFAEIKLAITHIFDGKPLNSFENKILEKIVQAGVVIPLNKKDKNKLKINLLRGLRRQSGLKNQINQGLVYFDQYRNTIQKYLNIFELPEEILAIAFVESSFNIKAHSRAGAVGVWQFIKNTGNSFLNISDNYDERKNVILSTLGAFHLLKQNFRIHGSWPLAISAYNSGHKHILKARNLNKKGQFSFQKFLENYSHADIMFASKNYFSEVLAMVLSLKYRKYFYNSTANDSYKEFYLYKSLHYSNLQKTSTQLGLDRLRLHGLNPHLPSQSHSPLMVTLTLDQIVDHPEYILIDDKLVTKYFPKNFKKISKTKAAR